MFRNMNKLIAGNPAFQFAKKAMRDKPVYLSDRFSNSGLSLGLGQELIGDSDRRHHESVTRHRMFLNMMKFDIQQRSTV